MGVAGSGKSTIGNLLSERLGWEFIEGDDFHPAENVEKMSAGLPLNDQDRLPWLKQLNAHLRETQASGNPVIISCSALKRDYREALQSGIDDLIFIYLQGDFQTIIRRLQKRKKHFMKPEMLRSQFEILEPPGVEEALIVSIEQSIEKNLERIVRAAKFEN